MEEEVKLFLRQLLNITNKYLKINSTDITTGLKVKTSPTTKEVVPAKGSEQGQLLGR